MDGCLVLSDRPGGAGGEALPGAVELLGRLRAAGIPFALCTNASGSPPAALAEHLRALGLPVEAGEVVTPPVVAAEYMAGERGRGPVLAFAGPGVVEPLVERGIEVLALEAAERAAAVLIGWDAEFGQAKLEAACAAVAAGAELLLSSPARSFAGRRRPQVGLSGAIAAGITFVTGVAPKVIGKPSERVIELVRHRLGVPADRLLVVGDDPALEVAMGRRAGCPTALVLTGVAGPDAAAGLAGELRPDIVLGGVDELARELVSR